MAQQTRYKPLIEPSELLNRLLERNGLSHKDLAEILGVDISSAAGILKGTRSITPVYAQRLGERFALRPALFLALEYRIPPPQQPKAKEAQDMAYGGTRRSF